LKTAANPFAVHIHLFKRSGDASDEFKSGGTVLSAIVPARLGAVEEVIVETGGLKREGTVHTFGNGVSVVIPAYNEEKAVGPQVESIRLVLTSHKINHEIIVIDDRSDDRTAEEAVRAGARVFRHFKNRGYGASLKTGILAAKYDAIVITDADGTYPCDQIPPMLKLLGTADMVVGARVGEKVSIPLVRKPGKLILGMLANRIAGQKIPDLNSGLRVFRRECVEQYFPVLSNKFSFTTTMTLALLADDYQIIYHPINYYRRIGKSKMAPRHFIDFTILVIRMAMLFQPLKVFVPIVCMSGLAGIIKVAFDITAAAIRHGGFGWTMFSEPAISTSALLLLLGSYQLLLIGMVADGLIRRIARHNQPRVLSHGALVSEISKGQQLEEQAVATHAEN
jgi:glycosyltransferase involved in cell wall biosynthesis